MSGSSNLAAFGSVAAVPARQTGGVTDEFRIGRRFQGPTGSGQGGWTAHRFEASVGRPLQVSIRAPIPLETDLAVARESWDEAAWRLGLPDGGPAGTPIMTGRPRGLLDVDTSPVSIDAAAAARRTFGQLVGDHPVPGCFSCGLLDDSMCVHAAPLGDGTDRYATDWTVPSWALAVGGVDEGVLWAALDCAAAWYVCRSRERRTAFTVQFAVDVLAALEVGETYALVAWSGGADDDWDGRKRCAGSVAFDREGKCVARSTSFWVSVEE